MSETAAALFELAGRLHPVMLHLPIGLLVGLAAIEMAAMIRGTPAPREITRTLILLTALATLLAAGSGYALGRANADSGLTFARHQQLGIALAAACVVTALVHLASNSVRAYRLCLLLTLALLVPVGHLGGSMTHGDGFLKRPLARVLRATASAIDPKRTTPPQTAIVRAEPTSTALPESSLPAEESALAPDESQPTVETIAVAQAEATTAVVPDGFAGRIMPILTESCVDCHGASRQKGGLALHNASALLKGGRNGPVLAAGRPEESELIRRLRLPLDDRRHMPPSGKPQLNEEQIRTIEAWIAEADVPRPATITLASAAGQDRTDPAPSAASTKQIPLSQRAALQALSDHLVHYERAGADSGLLAVNFAAAAGETDDEIARRLLEPLLEQLHTLTLSQAQVGDPTTILLARASQLRRLDLRDTAVTGSGLKALRELPLLEELVLARTHLNDEAIEHLAAMPTLKRVFLWDSRISPEAVADLRTRRPELHVDNGSFEAAAAREVEPEIVLTGDAQLPGQQATAQPADPAANIASANLAAVNSLCPVSGQPVDARYTILHESRLIGFCCPHCPAQFWADPAKFEVKLREPVPVADAIGD